MDRQSTRESKTQQDFISKVVDSDDWVKQDAYYEVLKTLYELTRGAETVDLLISNFVYEKQGATRKKIMQYRHCFSDKPDFRMG